MEKALVDLIIQVGPFIAPVFLTQALKTTFGIPKRFIPIIPYLVALVLVVLKALGTGQPLTLNNFFQIIYESGVIGSVSIALYNVYQKTIKGKE